jgi:class 3 adenylate cyclase
MGAFAPHAGIGTGSVAIGDLSTLTVVFTDLVGSTAQRVRLGDEVADGLVLRHDALVADAVASFGGRVVKTLGDGVMACFGSASDAVAAAVALQQALARHDAQAPHEQRLQVRVGIATGDVREQGGDLLGTPVVEAARLCSSATGGEIVVAELVRLLARGRAELGFEPLGELVLRGLPEPVPACRVLWTPLPADTAGPLPLPPVLAAAQASSYVGRVAQLDELAQAWKAALGGTRSTVLLAGEPGIGKTRTAAELARQVHAGGALVLFGRCDEGLAAPYQPFVEALEAYARAAGRAAELGGLRGSCSGWCPSCARSDLLGCARWRPTCGRRSTGCSRR